LVRTGEGHRGFVSFGKGFGCAKVVVVFGSRRVGGVTSIIIGLEGVSVDEFVLCATTRRDFAQTLSGRTIVIATARLQFSWQ